MKLNTQRTTLGLLSGLRNTAFGLNPFKVKCGTFCDTTRDPKNVMRNTASNVAALCPFRYGHSSPLKIDTWIRMKFTPKLFGLFSMAALLTASAGAASAVNSEDKLTNDVAAEAPPPAVEQYNYPGADQIFTERSIRLLRGDGNIVLVDCGAEKTVIKVEAVEVGISCYEVLGETGWLTLEIPRVYTIEGDEHNVVAHLTSNGKTQVVDIDPGEHTSVGEGQADGDPSTLVKLHAS